MILKRGAKLEGASTLLIVSAFVLQVCLFAPLLLIAQNLGEFSLKFADVLKVFSALSAGLIVVLFLLVYLLRSRILLALVGFLGAVAFVESRFLFLYAKHDPFDGRLIDWDALQWLSWVELAVIVTLGVVFLLLRKRTGFLSAAALFILLFLSAGFAYRMALYYPYIMQNEQREPQAFPYVDGFHRLSAERNIIHIVPDQAQGAMLHDIIEADSGHYAEVFDGFTFYTQAMARFRGTYPSVVFYMAGESPEPQEDQVRSQPFSRDYIERVLEDRSIVTALAGAGFRTFGFQFHPGIFCKGPYTACTGTHDEVFAGVAADSAERRFSLAVLYAQDLALFQSTPVFLRRHVFDDGQWFVKKLGTGVRSHSGILDIFIDRMEVNENPGTYNYIHHAGAHAPLLFDRDCRYRGPQEVNQENQREQFLCTLSQLEKLVATLKEHGVYDQTMIVINGDHGSPWLPPGYPAKTGPVVTQRLMGMTSALLMIKPPGRRGPLTISDRPVTIGDIPATIADVFDLDADFAGVSLVNSQADSERERYFYTYDSSAEVHRLNALPNLVRYRIRGNVFDSDSWLLPNAGQADAYVSRLLMDNAAFDRHAQGFSRLEQHNMPVRWVDGQWASVRLSTPADGPLQLEFDSFVPKRMTGQSMEILIDGMAIAKLDAAALRIRRHRIRIPDHLLPAKELEFEFRLAKTLGNDRDTRRLSILFSYIGLVPGE